MERFNGQKFKQHRQEETRGQDKAKEKIKDYDQIDGFFDKQKTTKGKNYNLKQPRTCVSITIRLHSCAAPRNASANSAYSTPLKSTPGKISRTRASNRLESANVSLESVLTRTACTTRRASTLAFTALKVKRSDG